MTKADLVAYVAKKASLTAKAGREAVAAVFGGITDALKNLIHRDRVVPLSPKYHTLFGLSGAISITSWSTIYILDFLKLNFTYGEFFLGYVFLIGAAFIIHHFLDETAFKRI